MHHVGPIAGIAAHGPWVATAAYDNRLILWDATTRQPLARASHDHLVNACAFSHDGRSLVSASSDYSARVWSLPGLSLEVVLIGHGDDVDMACFSPDDTLIATCALDRVVRVFTRSGRCLHALTGHTGNVLSLAWIDQRRFITTSVDGTLREWDAMDGTAVRTTDLGMRSDCVAIAADGRVYAGDDLGRIAVMAPACEPQFVQAHQAGVKKIVLSGCGTRLVTLGYDRMMAVWDLAAGALPALVTRSVLPPTIWARSAAMQTDGLIATGTFGGTYALFDPVTSSWKLDGVEAGDAINAVIEHDGAIHSIGDAGVLRIDGAAAGGPGTLCNFLVATPEGVFTGGHLGELCDGRSGAILHAHHSPLNCAVPFVREGAPHLAVGTYTGEILLFNLIGDGTRLVDTLRTHTNAIKGLAAADGVLFSVCANTEIAWHALADGRELQRIPFAHTRIANACCALGDGAFASVGRDRMLRLWLPRGETAVRTPHPNSVKCIAASPCGRWIASGSYGGTVAIFDRQSMRFAPMQRISKAGIAALCWSAARARFVAATYNGEVHHLAIVDQINLRAAA